MSFLTPLRRLFEPPAQPITFDYSGLPGHEGRRGLGMHTYTGRFYFPCDPRAEDVCIEDIAHHLSMQCRFAGASLRFVSVAEHSLLCSLIEGPEIGPHDQLEALMHDGAEAYLQDFIRPLKYLPQFATVYSALERLNEAVIARKFGLRWPWLPHVKTVDEIVCNLEMRDNIRRADKGRLHDVLPIPKNMRLMYLLPKDAEELFLKRFYQLTQEIKAQAACGKLAA